MICDDALVALPHLPLGGRPRSAAPAWTHGEPSVLLALLPLAQVGAAVIVAVRSPEHRVNVKRFWGVVVEEHPAMMIELGDDDRRLNAVIEHVALSVPADPA